MSMLDTYTDGRPIGMDHPLFMARMQAWIDSSMTAKAGVPLADALRSVRLRMLDLFGDVPLAVVDAVVVQTYATHAVQGAGESE